MYYTYILYSKSLNIFHKGSANNIKSRLKRHNNGYESFTANGLPWLLLWFTTKASKSEAYQLELKLKNLSQKRIIQFILKYKEGIVNPDNPDIKSILMFKP